MPLYEYYCADCHGVFELLRPVREASNPQPCPECDAESRRLMPKDFAAFVVREGLPRRVPDTGKYWTRDGLSDRAETGDAYQTTPHEAAWSKGFATPSDDDAEEWRIRRMQEDEERGRDLGMMEIDVQLAEASRDYEQRKMNTAVLKKRLKSAPNKDVTPRTRTGSHVPSTLAKKSRTKPDS
jgi:putative FmdB family regulatory protein